MNSISCVTVPDRCMVRSGRRRAALAAVAALFSLLAGACGSDTLSSRIHYVDAAASQGGDGTSWERAMNHPEDALRVASPGDAVWVAGGLYGPLASDGREVLRLREGVVVLGGFAGTETDPRERPSPREPTILDGGGVSRHVVIGADRAVLDGFTITGGRADGGIAQTASGGTFSGGGMFNVGVSPEVRNCRFTGNAASYNGGAMYNEDSDPLIVDCEFEENSAAFGAAMDNRGSSPTVVNTRFAGNRSTVSGGAVSNFGGSPVFINTVFSGNRSGQVGGAVLSNTSGDSYINCSLTGNRAQLSGGAISTWRGSVRIINSILWSNVSSTDGPLSNTEGEMSVLYSLIEGGYAGTGNLDAPPQFANQGFWDGNGVWVEGDYHLGALSPAIDRGNRVGAPDFDADYTDRPQFTAHDMGAYERPDQRVSPE